MPEKRRKLDAEFREELSGWCASRGKPIAQNAVVARIVPTGTAEPVCPKTGLKS